MTKFFVESLRLCLNFTRKFADYSNDELREMLQEIKMKGADQTRFFSMVKSLRHLTTCVRCLTGLARTQVPCHLTGCGAFPTPAR